VLIDAEEEDRWTLYVLGSPDADPVQVVKVLIKELVDQALRVQLEEEFGAVRTLIVAQAFSEGNLLDSDQDAAAPDASIPPNRDGR
jgi:His-Xaa-Ser system protein HxsD